MAYLNSKKTIFAVTSPRTIEKIIPEIKLLTTHLSGKKWSKVQIEYFDLFVRVEQPNQNNH